MALQKAAGPQVVQMTFEGVAKFLGVLVNLFLSLLTTWMVQKPAPSWREQLMCWRATIQRNLNSLERWAGRNLSQFRKGKYRVTHLRLNNSIR